MRIIALARAAVVAPLLIGCGFDQAGHAAFRSHGGFQAGRASEGNATFQAIAFSHDGSLIVTASDESWPPRIRLTDARSGRLVRSIQASYTRPRLVISADAKRVVTWVRGDAARPGSPAYEVRDIEGDSVIGTAPWGGNQQQLIGFGPTDNDLVLVSPDRLAVWDYVAGRMVAQAPFAQDTGRYQTRLWISIPTLSPDGGRLVYADSLEHLHLFDTREGTVTRVPFDEPWVYGLVFTRDSRTVAIGGRDRITLRDLGTGATRQTSACPYKRNQFLVPRVFAPGDTTLLAEGDEGQVCLFRVATGELLQRMQSPIATGYDQVQVSADASRAAVYRVNDVLEVWDTQTGRVLREVCPVVCHTTHGRPTRHFSLSPDGRLLFDADGFGTGAWDPSTGNRVYTMDDPAMAASKR